MTHATYVFENISSSYVNATKKRIGGMSISNGIQIPYGSAYRQYYTVAY